MDDFKIRFEWEQSPRSRVPELDATWARLQIDIGSESATRVEVTRSESIRSAIYVPLYPIAEWMVTNWWSLWHEWRRTPGRESGHCLLSAREGFALPDLSFWPSESQIELDWRRSTAPSAGLSFLTGGTARLPKQLVRDEFCRLVLAVLERLDQRNVHGSYLSEEWAAIEAAEQDPEQRAFCERAARLGCNPFDLEASTAEQIERLGSQLPESLIDDFCDSIRLDEFASGSATLRAFLTDAGLATPVAGHWDECSARIREHESVAPWNDGYRQAQALRAYLGIEGPILDDLQDLLRDRLGSLEIRPLATVSNIDAISAPSPSGAPVFGLRLRQREDQNRFTISRAIAGFLPRGLPTLVTRGIAEHQQRNRAFAAEFLAPAASIRTRLLSPSLADEDVEELAREFRVSDYVIRHQIQNHNLAKLSAYH